MNLSPIFQYHPSKATTLGLGLGAIIILGILDFLTGYEVSMFVFYGIPIAVVGWLSGKKPGLLLALLAGLTWWWADRLALHPYRWGWLQGWETVVRVSFFILTGWIGASIRAHHETAKSRIRLLEYSNELEQQIVSISEDERRRIGQDLHDGLCQCLAALAYSAASLQVELQNAGCTALVPRAQDLGERLKDSIVQTRDLARGLVPVQMDNAGLASALEELALSTSRFLNTDCVFHCSSGDSISDQTIANHLYRIAQEAINNATKHGKAKRIDMHLKATDALVELIVEDNGVGIKKVARNSKGMGLKIMDYRARSLGGRLDVGICPSGGTRVYCTARQRNCSDYFNGIHAQHS